MNAYTGRKYIYGGGRGEEAAGKVCLLSELRHNQKVKNRLVSC